MAKQYPAWQYLLAGCVFLLYGASAIYNAIQNLLVNSSNLPLFAVLTVFGVILIVIGARWALRGWRLEANGPSPTGFV